MSVKCFHKFINFLFYLPLGGQKAFYNKCTDFAGLNAGDIVLDVCCGTGKMEETIAARGIEVNIIGIDISGQAIKESEEKNRNVSASFIKANASDLPFQSSRFDKSIICFGLHHIPSRVRKQALKEIHRTLASEGTLTIIDYNLPKRGLRRIAAATIAKLDNKAEPYRMLKGGKLKRELEEAQFKIVERVLVYRGTVQLLKAINRQHDI